MNNPTIRKPRSTGGGCALALQDDTRHPDFSTRSTELNDVPCRKWPIAHGLVKFHRIFALFVERAQLIDAYAYVCVGARPSVGVLCDTNDTPTVGLEADDARRHFRVASADAPSLLRVHDTHKRHGCGHEVLRALDHHPAVGELDHIRVSRTALTATVSVVAERLDDHAARRALRRCVDHHQ